MANQRRSPAKGYAVVEKRTAASRANYSRRMCGRYSVAPPGTAEDIAELFEAIDRGDLAPRYNVAPSQNAPVVRLDGTSEREIVSLRWGLVPFFAKDAKVGFSNINARAETVADKPAFREAFERRRCLVIATGYYEWQPTGNKTKQPFNIHPIDAPVFAMAGIWERWKGPAGDGIQSFAIITTGAATGLSAIHDRMPAILEPASWSLWLDPDAPRARLTGLLKPYPGERLEAYRVDARVGSHKNDDPACVAPLAES